MKIPSTCLRFDRYPLKNLTIKATQSSIDLPLGTRRQGALPCNHLGEAFRATDWCRGGIPDRSGAARGIWQQVSAGLECGPLPSGPPPELNPPIPFKKVLVKEKHPPHAEKAVFSAAYGPLFDKRSRVNRSCSAGHITRTSWRPDPFAGLPMGAFAPSVLRAARSIPDSSSASQPVSQSPRAPLIAEAVSSASSPAGASDGVSDGSRAAPSISRERVRVSSIHNRRSARVLS